MERSCCRTRIPPRSVLVHGAALRLIGRPLGPPVASVRLPQVAGREVAQFRAFARLLVHGVSFRRSPVGSFVSLCTKRAKSPRSGAVARAWPGTAPAHCIEGRPGQPASEGHAPGSVGVGFAGRRKPGPSPSAPSIARLVSTPRRSVVGGAGLRLFCVKTSTTNRVRTSSTWRTSTSAPVVGRAPSSASVVGQFPGLRPTTTSASIAAGQVSPNRYIGTLHQVIRGTLRNCTWPPGLAAPLLPAYSRACHPILPALPAQHSNLYPRPALDPSNHPSGTNLVTPLSSRKHPLFT